jgi:hypothetical protein
MGKYKLTFWFFGFYGFYFLVRFIRTNWVDAPLFIKYYLTDLLFVPTMCLFALIIIRFLKRDNTITISPALIFTQIVLVSIYFEWYLPKYKSHIHPYTSDLWDVLMYILGGFLFWRLQKKFYSKN